jgi:hypothetical protein
MFARKAQELAHIIEPTQVVGSNLACKCETRVKVTETVSATLAYYDVELVLPLKSFYTL